MANVGSEPSGRLRLGLPARGSNDRFEGALLPDGSALRDGRFCQKQTFMAGNLRDWHCSEAVKHFPVRGRPLSAKLQDGNSLSAPGPIDDNQSLVRQMGSRSEIRHIDPVRATPASGEVNGSRGVPLELPLFP